MRIAVFGNSHVGMLRAASTQDEFDHCTFAWMARHTPGTRDFEVRGTSIVDTTKGRLHAPGLEAHLDLAEFDAVVIAGNTIRVNDVARLIRSHFVPAWTGATKANQIMAAGKRSGKQLYPMTEVALHATLRALISDNLTFAWLSALHDAVDIPFFVVPPVFAREAVLSPDTERHEAFRSIADQDVFDHLAQAFRAAHLDVFSAFGRATVILQDERTITHGFFTKDAFSRGATGLDPAKAYAEDDMLHGNPEMGRLTLNEIVRNIG